MLLAFTYFIVWNGEEGLPITKKRSICWADIITPYDLVLADREFWEIARSDELYEVFQNHVLLLHLPA